MPGWTWDTLSSSHGFHTMRYVGGEITFRSRAARNPKLETLHLKRKVHRKNRTTSAINRVPRTFSCFVPESHLLNPKAV